MSDVSNPHDNFFKELLSQPANARDFLRYYLPPAIVAEFDLRKVELVKDAFVDADLQKHLADLLYRVKLKRGDEAFVFVLFEHKSAPDNWVALQILRYIVCLWQQEHTNGVKLLPPVYPIVLYHGRRRWNVPRNLRSLVAIRNDSPMLQFVPEFEYYLVDLAVLREEDLHGAPYLKAGLLALKFIFDRELAIRLPDIFEMLNKEPARPLIEHFKVVSQYLSKVKNAVEPARLKQVVQQVFQDRGEKIMADFFQEWINQGLQQGREQGLQQGLQEGLQKGLQQGLRQARFSLTLKQLEKRFGKVTKAAQQQIKKLPSEKIEELGLALLDFQSSKDLRLWLQQNDRTN